MKQTEHRYVFDIETDGLLEQLSKAHCIVIKDIDTDELWQYTPDQLQEGLERLSQAKVLIGHNIINFDIPALKKALEWSPGADVEMIDTLILSKYDNPDRMLPKGCPTVYEGADGRNKKIGPHSLAAFGYLLGRHKPEHSDWATYSKEMLHRCTEDVHINHKTLDYLLEQLGLSADTLLNKENRKAILGGSNMKAYSVFSPVYDCKPEPINGFWLEIAFARLCQDQMERKCKIIHKTLYDNIESLTGIVTVIATAVEQDLGLYANCVQPKMAYAKYHKDKLKALSKQLDSTELLSVTMEESTIGQAHLCLSRLRDNATGAALKAIDKIWPSIDELRTYKGYRAWVKKPFLKNGNLSATTLEFCEEANLDGATVAGPFTKVQFDQIRTSQREKICQVMLRRGWKPTSFTEVTEKGGGGNPQLTINKEPCPGLAHVEGGLGQDYITWVMATKRLEMHQAFRDNMDENGMIPALVDSVGTNTYRVKHRLIANLPRAGGGTFFGTETRSVIGVPDGYKMLGADMSGLENRVAAHYTVPLDQGRYAKEVLEGDCHTQFRLGMVDLLGKQCPEVLKDPKQGRNVAKTLTYAILYGASAGKVASVLGLSDAFGKKAVEAFWKVNDSLASLKDLCGQMHERDGYVIGIDGRKVRTRSSHSAMNCLFQSAGVIVFKIATVAAYRKSGGQMEQVITYHDENQWQVKKDEVKTTQPMSKEKLTKITESGKILSVPKEEDAGLVCTYHPHGELFVQASRYAGKLLRCNVEFDAEYSIGDNWAETH